MNKYIHLFLLFTLLVTINIVCTAQSTNNHWTCVAYDSENKHWDATNEYDRVAMNRALENCKKESTKPKSCEATKELCQFVGNKERALNNQSSKGAGAKWQCTALDQTATPWVGDPSADKYAAALGAKSYCREKSTEPETCYINLLTCTNLNEGT